MNINLDIAFVVSALGGGMVGSIIALAGRQPATAREGASRFLTGLLSAAMSVGWVCEYFGVPTDQHQKVIAIAAVLGICGWHAVSIIMMLLDTLSDLAEKRKMAIIAVLLKAMKWPGGPPPEGK